MKKRLVKKTMFVVLAEEVVDNYIYENYLEFTGCSFYLNMGNVERRLPIREGKEEFWKEFSKINPENKEIYITEKDFVVLRCFLKYPLNFLDAIEKFLEQMEEEQQLDEDEEEIYFEEYGDDYDPRDDNFNIDDVESDYYEDDE